MNLSIWLVFSCLFQIMLAKLRYEYSPIKTIEYIKPFRMIEDGKNSKVV